MSIMTEHTCTAWAIYMNLSISPPCRQGLAKGHFRGVLKEGEAALWWHKEDKEVTKWSASALGCHMKNITENRALSLKKKKNTFLPAIQKFRMGNLLMSGWDQRLDHSQLLYWTLSALERWSSEHCRDRINLIIIIITMAIIIVITIMAIIIIVAISFQ